MYMQVYDRVGAAAGRAGWTPPCIPVPPPQAPWFSQILLYWDQAAAIVSGSIRDPANISRETVDLVNHQLLTYLGPDVYPHRQKFQQRFLDASHPAHDQGNLFGRTTGVVQQLQPHRSDRLTALPG